MPRPDTRPTTIKKGGGLGYYPPGKIELEVRKQRKAMIAECRKTATVEIRDGRRWKVIRLPDGYGADYPVQVDEEDAA
jgi:hypothetical protein